MCIRDSLREVTFGDNGIFKTIKENAVYKTTQQLQQQLLEKFMNMQKKMVSVH